jgi:putative DNA primase/helicase
MKTIDAMRGKTALILSHYNLPPITGKSHFKGKCPICQGLNKFRIDDKDGLGSWICVCGSGNIIRLLEEVTGKDFKTLAREVDVIIGNTFFQDERQPTQKLDKAMEARNRFLSLPNLKGTDAENYLRSRGLYASPRSGVRWSSGEYDHDEQRSIPCMYAIASNEYGEPVYRHVTYIENGAKAAVEKQRKMLTLQENHGSVAIKLANSGTVLGIAEGIETALSATAIYKLPCWAVVNASLMQRFRAPTGAKSLYIFADNDKNGTGLAAAFACGRANLMTKNDVENVVIRWPMKVNDFNDFLNQGDEVVEWVLTR